MRKINVIIKYMFIHIILAPALNEYLSKRSTMTIRIFGQINQNKIYTSNGSYVITFQIDMVVGFAKLKSEEEVISNINAYFWLVWIDTYS